MRLDDEQLEAALRSALRGDGVCAQCGLRPTEHADPAVDHAYVGIAALRAEAARRFAGKLGLPRHLMEDTPSHA